MSILVVHELTLKWKEFKDAKCTKSWCPLKQVLKVKLYARTYLEYK